jgi:O-antigen/teichoic acid export membrane protein
MAPRNPQRRSLLRNSVYIMLTTGVNSGLGYVFWLVIARAYDASVVGVASALIAAMTVVAAIADLGTSTALIQRLPRERGEAEWSRTLTASLVTASAAGLATALVAGLVVIPEVDPSLQVVSSSAGYLAVFVLGVPLWSLSVVSDFLFVAERRSENMFARNFVFGLAKLVVVALLVVAGSEDALGIFAAWVGGCALSLAAGYVALMPRLGRRYRPSLAGVRGQIRSLAGSFAGNYLITLGYLLTTFLLPVLVIARLSPADNAYFYVAWLLGGAFFTVTTAVGSALFAEGSHDADALDAQTRSAVRITAALIGPVVVVFLVAGGPILQLFGEEYADNGRTLLLLLTASAIPNAVTGLYLSRVRAEGRLGFASAVSMGMAAITLVGAWFLLPELELDGVGVAFIAAHALGAVVCGLDRLRVVRATSAAGPASA